MTPTTPSTPAADAAGDVQAMLDANAPRPWWRRPALGVGLLLLGAAVAGGLAWRGRQQAAAAPSFVTEAVIRGTLTLSVTANGTLQPTRSVTIGSELSGTVARVLVDVNDRVTKGQLLVELDPAKLDAQVLRSRASLASAESRVAQAVATTKESQAGLARLEEVARLSGGKVPSSAELDAARAALDRARADEVAARASVADARAALSTDETNRAKSAIRSPIDGVVLTRSVEPGNAVAASLQAVTLMTIAEDLSRLKLQVNVDEADVGAVLPGQKAEFSVSAYPSRRYPATITRVAYGSTTTDNVVTYVTTLDAGNADLSLRPGMTATATITATERRDVLLVPNTALRFAPTNGATAVAGSGSSSIVSRLVPRPPGGAARKTAGAAAGSAGPQRVWVLREGRAEPLPVTTGISDGRLTEVSGAGLEPGLAVIVDQRSGTAK